MRLFAETIGYSIGSRYRLSILRPNHMNLGNEIRRSAHRLYPAAYPASCGRAGNLWPVDDRRIGRSWLPPQPGDAVPDASRDGAQRLSDLTRAARRTCRAKTLQGDQARQTGARAGEAPGSGLYRRSNEARALIAGACR